MSKQTESWVVLRDMLEKEGIARQHLNSYNELVSRELQKIVDEIGEMEIETGSAPYKIRFGRVSLGTPRVVETDGSINAVLPLEARLRNLSYSAPIFLETVTIIEGEVTGETVKQHIGDLPVMVKSEICRLFNMSKGELIEAGEDPNDPGGYFIVNGSERVIIGLEDLSPNRILVSAEKSLGAAVYRARVFSSVTGYRSKMELALREDGAIGVKVPSCPVELPFVIVMRALLAKPDKEIADSVSPKPEIQELLEPSFENASEASGEKDSLVYIGNRIAHGMLEESRIRRAKSMLDWSLLPHLGRSEDRREDKALFMGEAACRLLELKLGWTEPDDRDHYGNKVIKFAGPMLADIFRIAFRNLVRDMKYQLERPGKRKGGGVLGASIRTGIITDRLNNSLATGNWGRGKVGATQLLDRTNHLSTLSHLRRVQSPLSRSQPNFEARDLHATHFGRICPSETPEGVNCVGPKTMVLMDDGNQASIGDLAKKWQTLKIRSFDPLQGLAVSQIADYIRTNPVREGTPVYRITTEAGRSIVATADHPFLTEGLKWKSASALEVGDAVVVSPTIEQAQNERKSGAILTESDFPARKKWEKVWVPDHLKKTGLLPLRYSDPRVLLLARISGALFSDGHLHMCTCPFITFSVGHLEDANDVAADLNTLGFKSSIEHKIKTFKLKGKPCTMDVFEVTCYSKLLCTLLQKLGVPAGKKTDHRFSIPKWIASGTRRVKQEFLGSYFGGDGTKPAISFVKGSKYIIRLPPISFHKIRGLGRSGLEMGAQLAKLMREFGCVINDIRMKKAYVRADGKTVMKITLNIAGSVSTTTAVTRKIPYHYSSLKRFRALSVGEYLRIREQVVATRKEEMRLAELMYKHGMTPREIASGLRKTRRTVERWLYEAPYKTSHKPPSELVSFPIWEKKNVFTIGNGVFVVERILEKEPMRDVNDVRDVRTVTELHNFIANSFVTHNCGLVKNLALSASISVAVPSAQIEQKLRELGVKPIKDCDQDLQSSGYRMFVDGRFIGYVKDGEKLATEFRRLRREGQIDSGASILLDTPINEKAYSRIYIGLSSGRILRPLVVVEKGRSLLTQGLIEKVSTGQLSWKDLMDKGVLELLDANEEENILVVMKPEDITQEHTHLELFPAAILGAVASIIPYPEHNQSPRNAYESAMAKQSIGFSSPAYSASPQVKQHLLVSPQTPLVGTKPLGLLKLDERPIGQNCIVAVLSYEGYNIEDAIVMNKSSIERGMARSFFYRLYEAQAKQYLGGMKDTFEIPSADSNVRGYRGEKFYRLLEADGVVSHEASVSGGDVMIGRTSPPRFMEEYKKVEKALPRRDTSIAMRQSESGIVDMVSMTMDREGGKLYKVRVRDMRVPEVGDKFASRHGQKGVIGVVVPQEDMPYTAEGIVPDIIINPHAFPSRMTVAQFIESIAGKAGALRGFPADGTAFAGEEMGEFEEVLKGHGFKPTGMETMYDGRTGKRFVADVFIGVVYYQKLNHMVADKIHARARGQVQMLTKQPTEGRARGGGMRFGEMERDCLIAYGASMVLKDRLLDEADKTEIHVCEKCGLMAYYDAKLRKYICRTDGNKVKISTVTVAYAFKLLLQEMISLDIAPRLQLKDKV